MGARIEIGRDTLYPHVTEVAPLVGARIEITSDGWTIGEYLGRSPRGSED